MSEFDDQPPYLVGRRRRLLAVTIVLFVIPATIIFGMIWGLGLAKSIEPSDAFIAEPTIVVPPFTFYGHQGDTLTPAVMADKVYVLHFFDPTCGEPCEPRLRALRDVQYAISRFKHFRLLSISVNPVPDRNALWMFGRQHSNYTGWHFADGSAQDVTAVMDGVALSGRTFALGSPEEAVLVDRKGMVRGYYLPTDSSGYRQIIDDIVYLLLDKE